MKTTKTESQIKDAINRSQSHNEIVNVTIAGDSADAMNAIRALVDCEIDYAMTDYDTMDVWGFDETAKNGEMLWRLAIRFRGGRNCVA